MALIPLEMARADKAQAVCAVQLAGGAEAADGYFFQAMLVDQDGKPYVQADAPLPKANNAPHGACTNRDRFGFTTFPDRYGHDGCLVFIVGEDGILYQKDLGEAAGPVLDRKAAAPDSVGSDWNQL